MNFVVTQRKITLDNHGVLDTRLVLANKHETILVKISGGDNLTQALKVLMRGDVDNLTGAVVVLTNPSQSDLESNTRTLQNPIDEDIAVQVELLDTTRQE